MLNGIFVYYDCIKIDWQEINREIHVAVKKLTKIYLKDRNYFLIVAEMLNSYNFLRKSARLA